MIVMAVGFHGSLAVFGGCAEEELGPKCQAYYGQNKCCMELAGTNEVMKNACDTSLKAIEDAIDDGKAPADFEAACGTALDTAQQQGQCLTEASKVCHPKGDFCEGCEDCNTYCSCREISTSGQIPAAECLQTCE
jgi:hypothetical protein